MELIKYIGQDPAHFFGSFIFIGGIIIAIGIAVAIARSNVTL
jgi:hypothetical protein